MQKKIDYIVLDDKSRPGYTQVKFTSNGRITWVRNVKEGEFDNCERQINTYEQLRVRGLIKGMKPKKFSELPEEEQKIVMGDDSTEK